MSVSIDSNAHALRVAKRCQVSAVGLWLESQASGEWRNPREVSEVLADLIEQLEEAYGYAPFGRTAEIYEGTIVRLLSMRRSALVAWGSDLANSGRSEVSA